MINVFFRVFANENVNVWSLEQASPHILWIGLYTGCSAPLLEVAAFLRVPDVLCWSSDGGDPFRVREQLFELFLRYFVVVEDVAMQMERAVSGPAFLADCYVVPLFIIVQLVILILLRIGNVKLPAADAGAVYFHHLIVVLRHFEAVWRTEKYESRCIIATARNWGVALAVTGMRMFFPIL